MGKKYRDREEYRTYMEEQLSIDPERLDEEIHVQPILYDRAQQAVFDWTRSLNTAKKDLNELRSELWLKIKKKPKKYGINTEGKAPTKDDVESALMHNEHYKRAVQLVESLEEQVEFHKNFVKSVEMKKSMLNRSVELFLGNYWSTPSVRKSIGGKKFSDFIYEKAEDRIRQGLRESRKKREENKKKTRDKINNPHVLKQFDEVTANEDKKLRSKKRKMLGLPKSKTKVKKSKDLLPPKRKRTV